MEAVFGLPGPTISGGQPKWDSVTDELSVDESEKYTNPMDEGDYRFESTEVIGMTTCYSHAALS